MRVTTQSIDNPVAIQVRPGMWIDREPILKVQNGYVHTHEGVVGTVADVIRRVKRKTCRIYEGKFEVGDVFMFDRTTSWTLVGCNHGRYLFSTDRRSPTLPAVEKPEAEFLALLRTGVLEVLVL